MACVSPTHLSHATSSSGLWRRIQPDVGKALAAFGGALELASVESSPATVKLCVRYADPFTAMRAALVLLTGLNAHARRSWRPLEVRIACFAKLPSNDANMDALIDSADDGQLLTDAQTAQLIGTGLLTERIDKAGRAEGVMRVLSYTSPSPQGSSESPPQAQPGRKDRLELVLAVAGAGAALAGWVAVVGGITMWVRFKKAGLPAHDVVASLPRDVLVTEGLRTLLVPLLLGTLAAALIYAAWPSSWSERNTVLGRGVYRVRRWLIDRGHDLWKRVRALRRGLRNILRHPVTLVRRLLAARVTPEEPAVQPQSLPTPVEKRVSQRAQWPPMTRAMTITFALLALALGLIALIGLYLGYRLSVDASGILLILLLTVAAIAAALGALWYIGAKTGLVAAIFLLVVVWSGALGYVREDHSTKLRLEPASVLLTGEATPIPALFIARSGDAVLLATARSFADGSAGARQRSRSCVVTILPSNRVKELQIGVTRGAPSCKQAAATLHTKTVTVTTTEATTTIATVQATTTVATTQTVPGPTTTLTTATTTVARVTTTVATTQTIPGPTTTVAGSTTTVTQTVPAGGLPLPHGHLSVPVATINPPDRLLISNVEFRPNVVRSRTPLSAIVTVVDSNSYRVRGAQVTVRTIPRLDLRTSGSATTNRAGVARIQLAPSTTLQLRSGVRLGLLVYVHASKPGDRRVASTYLRELFVRAPR